MKSQILCLDFSFGNISHSIKLDDGLNLMRGNQFIWNQEFPGRTCNMQDSKTCTTMIRKDGKKGPYNAVRLQIVGPRSI
jgi:hypothetical protein